MAIGDINCETCGGRGVISKGNNRFVKCPDCYTKSLNDMSTVREEELTDLEIVEILNTYNAPDYVKRKGFGFEFNKLKDDKSIDKDIREDIEFEAYVIGMEDIVEDARKGNKLSNSYLISSDKGFGKSYFIWDVIKSYLRRGKTVSQFKTSEDIINLKTLNTEESIEELKEYYSSDLIIFNLSGSIFKPRLHILAMFEVLNKVGSMNKPMVVITNYSRENILRFSSGYERALSYSGVEKGKYDTLKVVEYHEEHEEGFSFKNNR